MNECVEVPSTQIVQRIAGFGHIWDVALFNGICIHWTTPNVFACISNTIVISPQISCLCSDWTLSAEAVMPLQRFWKLSCRQVHKTFNRTEFSVRLSVKVENHQRSSYSYWLDYPNYDGIYTYTFDAQGFVGEKLHFTCEINRRRAGPSCSDSTIPTNQTSLEEKLQQARRSNAQRMMPSTYPANARIQSQFNSSNGSANMNVATQSPTAAARYPSTIRTNQQDYRVKKRNDLIQHLTRRAEEMRRLSQLNPGNGSANVNVAAQSQTAAVQNGKRKALSSDADTGNETEKRTATFSKGTAKLIERMTELLDNGISSDVVLIVEETQFKAHRLVLGMRSPVFAAMFSHDMAEKRTGVVQVEDCDLGTFPDFLRYVYTGQLDDVTVEKALHLCKTAHKYQLEELKEECLEYIGNNLTVEQFCDAYALSLLYEEAQLTQSATKFFLDNAARILVTENWAKFLAENAKEANNLFLEKLKRN